VDYHCGVAIYAQLNPRYLARVALAAQEDFSDDVDSLMNEVQQQTRHPQARQEGADNQSCEHPRQFVAFEGI
jgi:hypothetical protein